MSYFNEDQRSWSAYLAGLPKEAKCDCGWDHRGHCCGSCYGHPEKGGAMPRAKADEASEPTGGPPP